MLHSFPGEGGAAPRLYSPAGLVALAEGRCGRPAALPPLAWAALDRLCDAFEAARPEQTAFGKLHAQAVLLDALAKGIRLADYMRRFPEIGALDLPDPVFIVAPFRTGTTFLHRLLSCDPHNRCPRLWEVAYPPPADPDLRGEARYFAEDARIDRAGAALRMLHRAAPALGALHPMAPDLAEECFGLLETSFLSHSFFFYADLPTYLRWLDTRHDEDWAAAYEIYAEQLRLLHWWHPGRRWVLKSPVHLWNLGALLRTFPRAHIIQLHRDPVDALRSFQRLLTAWRQATCRTADPTAIGEQAERHAREMLRRAAGARRQADARRFIDVAFADLVRDPMACVRTIYARIGGRLEPDADL